MRQFVRLSVLATALFCALSFTAPGSAEARGGHGHGHSNFFFSANIGVPLGYYGGYYGFPWYRSAFYDPYYYGPRYYAPRGKNDGIS